MLDSTDDDDQDMTSVRQQSSSQQHAGTSGKHGTTKPKKQVLTSLPSLPLGPTSLLCSSLSPFRPSSILPSPPYSFHSFRTSCRWQGLLCRRHLMTMDGNPRVKRCACVFFDEL